MDANRAPQLKAIVIRLTSMNKIFLIIVILVLTPSVFGQKSTTPSLGWDLTYISVLSANRVAPDEWVRKWLGPNFQSPARQLISKWRDGPIESSVLLEHPAFHAGEHVTIWLVRTKHHAYYIELVEANPRHKLKESLSLHLYDKLFGMMSSWQQAQPLMPEDTPENGIPGYMGFLSFYNRGDSRQMLLTGEDFVICKTKKCDEAKLGRVYQALTILPRFKVQSDRRSTYNNALQLSAR